jgi:ABC-2 type transport system permease protein
MWALVLKEFRQLRRDKRTVALMVALPVLQLIVFGYAASFDVDRVTAIVVGPSAVQVSRNLPDFFDVQSTNARATRSAAIEDLRAGDADVALVTGLHPEVLVDGSQLFTARAVVTAVARMPDVAEPIVLFNPELETSVVMVPAIAGMILVFFGTLITSLGVVRERQAGTLEQLAVMPFRPSVRWIAYVLPLTYFIDIARAVMIRGASLDSIRLPMAMLAILGAAVFTLAVMRFRRDLAPSGGRRRPSAPAAASGAAG